jgi:hypothetical protein
MASLTKAMSVRLSTEERRMLAARAAAEDRKPSALARLLIRQGLQADKRKVSRAA